MAMNVENNMASIISSILGLQTNTTIINIQHDRPSNVFHVTNDQGHMFKIEVTNVIPGG